MTGISWNDLLTSFVLLLGLFFIFAGTLGLVRFPDVYTRLHAPSKATTLGLIGILIASLIHQFDTGSWGIKQILTAIFLFMTAPVGAHMMARAAFLTGVPPVGKTDASEFACLLSENEDEHEDANPTVES